MLRGQVQPVKGEAEAGRTVGPWCFGGAFVQRGEQGLGGQEVALVLQGAGRLGEQGAGRTGEPLVAREADVKRKGWARGWEDWGAPGALGEQVAWREGEGAGRDREPLVLRSSAPSL